MDVLRDRPLILIRYIKLILGPCSSLLCSYNLHCMRNLRNFRPFNLSPRISTTNILTMAPKRKLTNKASSKAPSKKIQTVLTSGITSAVSVTNAAKDIRGSVVPQAITTAAAEIGPTNNHTALAQGHDYDALIVNRTYYPPVLSNERCQAYLDGNIPTPHASLTKALADTAGFRAQATRDRAVVCWFRTDLRWDDNTALAMASTLAAGEVPVIGLFIHSPQDLDAHLMSPARMDFILRSLQVLKIDLEKKGIPLYCETVEKRKRIPGRVLELA